MFALSRFLTACGLLWLVTVPALAQTTTATVTVVAVDPSDATIPRVAVTLVNVATAVQRQATANEQGAVTFTFVVPGHYTLRAERDGFAPSETRTVVVNVGDDVLFRMSLSVGTLTDTVSVTASDLRNLNTSISTIITGDQLSELPVNSRGFQRLMLLAPGMVTSGTRGTQSNPAVSGTRNTSNNFVVDGMSANEERVGVAGIAPGSPSGLAVPDVISTEALQEFRVVTSNADASFGRGAGAQVSVVTKSGTNTLHGSGYEYFRHNRMDARDFFNQGPYFDDKRKSEPPPLRYHLFGVTAGGPIVPDRHFFFGSYEGFRQEEDLVASQTLPNAALINLIPGDLGRLFRLSFLDSVVPSTGNPAGEFRAFPIADRNAALVAGFPAALFDSDPANGEAGVVIASVPQPREYVQNAALVRSDHRLNDRVTIAARYARTRNVFERTSGRPGTLVTTTRDFDSGLGQLFATLTPSQIVEVRGGWLWNQAPVCSPDIPQELLALETTGRGANIGLTGTTAFQLPYISQPCTFIDTQRVPQVAVLHTWTRGPLTLRSGIDVRAVNVRFGNLGLGSPTHQFTGLVGANGLLGSGPAQLEGVAFAYTGTYFGGEGLPPDPLCTYRSVQQDYFTQADWRASSRLTVNLGLRYAAFGVYDIDEVANLFAVDPATGAVVSDVSPFTFGRTANRLEVTGGDRPIYQADRNNLQPRLGAAWDLFGRGRTIVKGAYGIYHDRLFQFGFANLVANRPFALSGSASNVPFVLGTLPALNPNTPGVFAIDPSIRNPYFHRTSVGIDQRLGWGTSVFVAYVGTFGRDLARNIDLNFGAGFPQAARPDPRFADMVMLTNISSSRYDALQLQLRSNPRPGVSATLAYTYSRFNDYLFQDTIGANQQIPTAFVNLGASAAAGFQVGAFADQPTDAYAGRSDQDLPHVLAISHLIELPFGRGRRWGRAMPGLFDALVGGWSLSGILQARSGAPINLTLGRDVNDDGYTTDRPSLLSGSLQDLYSGSEVKTQYLIAQAEALTRLGVAANVTDPFAQVPYNALRAPSVWSYDLSLQKQLALGGRARLAIEVNAFNVFNRANLAVPNANLTSALFGTVTGTVAGMGARQLQLGAKLTF